MHRRIARRGNTAARDERQESERLESTDDAGEPELTGTRPREEGRRIMEPQEGKMEGTSRSQPISTKRERIAELARQMPGKAMTSLSQHMDLAWLHEAHRCTRKDGATGVDGTTADEFATELENNLRGLLDAAKSGNYRAPPVRRVHIPKGSGSKTRPIGIPTYADKVLQRAVLMLMEPVYEQDFYDFSYGFRPGRSAHDALESLNEQLWAMRGGGWVLDVDIRGFFDSLDHEQLRNLLRQRVTDGVVVRLVGKWLRAGVLDGGVVHRTDTGTPQGGVISPLLANIYLHTVVDEWWVKEVQPRLRGASFMIRYADDFVLVFADREDALRVQEVLPQRLARYGLSLHPDKTRLVDFRRPNDNGDGPSPGGFDFLGFNHHWGRSRQGKWYPQRGTAKSRFSRACKSLNAWMRSARHLPLNEQAKTLGAKLRGHYQYYGLSGNSSGIGRFLYLARRLWRKWLSRRSQRGRLTWQDFANLERRHPLPPARLPRRVGRMQPRYANP